MKLSVIIPTAGNVLRVKNTIDSFLKQKIDNFNIEINIIENSKKNDQSNKLQEYFKNLPKKFKYSLDERPSSSEVRNRAAMKSNADLLAFIDDDVIISDKWIETVFKSFEKDSELVFLGGPNLPNFTTDTPEWFEEFISKFKDHWECHYLSLLEFKEDKEYIDPKFIWGLNSIILREKFIELGGYNPDRHAYELSEKKILRWAGDGDMGLADQIKKKNYKSSYKRDLLVYHLCDENRLTFDYFINRNYMQGIINSYTLIRNSDTHISKMYHVNLMKIIIRNIFKKIKCRLSPSKSIEIKKMKIKMINEYYKGFKFHHYEAKNDKRLLDWIKRENYWQSDIREEIRNFG